MSGNNDSVGSEEHDVHDNHIGNDDSAPPAVHSQQSHEGVSQLTQPLSESPDESGEANNQIDLVDMKNGVLRAEKERDPNDGKVVDDSVKEDMFVDCPDELGLYDGRNTDNQEAAASVGTGEHLEVKNRLDHQSQVKEMSNAVQDGDKMDEVEQLRATLENAIRDKERMSREHKEERETFRKGIFNLHCQLKVLTCQQSHGDDDGELVHRLHEIKVGDNVEETDISLKEVMNECSELLKITSIEHMRAQATVRELHAMLHTKDLEIEDLSSKVTELLVSNNVLESYLNSVQNSMELMSDSQLEKDHHVDSIMDRTIASLATVINQGQLRDDSISGKVFHIEEGTSHLIENYNQILSEINQISQCLSEVGLDVKENNYRTSVVAACSELLEFKRKEVDLAENLRQFEEGSKKLTEQLDKERMTVETMSAELDKLRGELEQEKVRCANTKEKLSMAVTKGKGLVQQRDSLKQSLADKTSELAKCLSELQERTSALDAAEHLKGQLVHHENMMVSLQESLSQSNSIIEKVEEILSESGFPEELQSVGIIERFRWIVDDRNVLKGVFIEFSNLKDALSSVDLPETVKSSNLESQMNWLKESFQMAKDEINMLTESLQMAKDEINMLQHEISTTKENANSQIDHLSVSLLMDLQEKDYLQKELADMKCKFEGIAEKNCQLSLEKDWMVKTLLEFSGLGMENEGFDQSSSDVSMIMTRCFQIIKEKSTHCSSSPQIDAELFERVQSLLYVNDMELNLSKDVLEEDILLRLEVNKLSNEFKVASKELLALKEENSCLQKDLERSEEKSTLIKEKLSMAVKKGKGLVQDRENLKSIINEKNSEIEQLKLDLQKQESAVAECRDQIHKLSIDVAKIPQFETDLAVIKGERDQFQQFLLERNNMLQRVTELINGIVLPVEFTFEEPVEKVKWFVRCFSECQSVKLHAEQELGQAREEASSFASKLADAQETIKFLEEALSDARYNISQLAEEKREIESRKTNVEEELENMKEEISSLSTKFAEVNLNAKSLEYVLSLKEKDMSTLSSEKQQAEACRATLETELEKLKEEASALTRKLADASKTIKSLEDALSHAENNIFLLTGQYSDSQVVITKMENQLKELQDELKFQDSKLADATLTIKSLETDLLKTKGDISKLEGEKKSATEEVLLLNSKLDACTEELAGRDGNLKIRSMELIGHLSDLQMLVKGDAIFSTVRQSFENKFQKLKSLGVILKDIKGRIVEMDAKDPGNQIRIKDDSNENSFPCDLDNLSFRMESMNYAEINVDTENISSHFRKTAEWLQLRNKVIVDQIEGFSYSMDDYISALLKELLETKSSLTNIFEHVESLKEEVKSMEMYKEEQKCTMAVLNKDATVLLTACTDVTRELQIAVESNLQEPSSISELETLKYGVDMTMENGKRFDGSKYNTIAHNLIYASRIVQALINKLKSKSNEAAETIKVLQNELEETRSASEKVLEERDHNQSRVFQLESDLQAVQNSCSELRLSLEQYHLQVENLKKRESELSSLYSSLLAKEQEAENSLLSASQVKTIFDKLDQIENPFLGSENGGIQPHKLSHVEQLFYILDRVAGWQHRINSLCHEKKEVDSALATQVLESERLEEKVEKLNRYLESSENLKNELSELTFALEKVLNMLGGGEIVRDQKSALKGLLPLLEKQVMAVTLESENSKSKAQELDNKLLGSQKVIDELTAKVKLLEDSLKGRMSEPEIVQERRIFEAQPLPTGSEISEVEDGGSLGKNTISPVPSAAHVLNMRKGSTDHLALDIDLESERLVNRIDTDEDKGHLFKSLNTSGLIPKQGKSVADRIDGIWVSGGRVLMSRPRARLGLIAYALLLHLWVLGSIL